MISGVKYFQFYYEFEFDSFMLGTGLLRDKFPRRIKTKI